MQNRQDEPTPPLPKLPPPVNSFDGFQAHHREAPDNKREIWVEMMGDGVPLAAHEVAQFPDDVEGRGSAARLHILTQAICRYVNAGGTVLELAETLRGMEEILVAGEVQFPEGWVIMNCLQGVEDPTIILVNADGSAAMVIAEDNYSEVMDIDDLASRLRSP